MTPHAPRWILALLISLGSATSCSTPVEPDVTSVATGDSALDGAMRRWTASRPAAYEFVLSFQCFCPPDILRATAVVVRGYVIESRRYADDGALVDSLQVGPALTVDGLFARIVDARARKAARIDATYHATLGYPMRVYIVYSTRIGDEELGFEARDLRAR